MKEKAYQKYRQECTMGQGKQNYYAKIKNFQDLENIWTNQSKEWQKQSRKSKKKER